MASRTVGRSIMARLKSFPNLVVRDGPQFDVIFEREVIAAADFQKGPLATLDLDACRSQFRPDLVGDQTNAVFVGMKQIAALDLDSGDHDRRTEID